MNMDEFGATLIFFLMFIALLLLFNNFKQEKKESENENIFQVQKQNCKPKQFEIFGKIYQLDFFEECE